MAWEKSSDALVAAFAAALPDDPRIERRKMFGYPCAFTGGRMFAGLHQQDIVLRLPAPRREALFAAGEARPFAPMPGRMMKEYAALAPPLTGDPQRLSALLAEGLAYVHALPPKPAKTGTRRGAADRRR